LPLQDLAAVRAATTTSASKPAEEQFIENTPWANPQHPSHLHLLQRQTSTHQPARTASPFSTPDTTQGQRASQQSGTSLPVSGTFTTHNLPPSTISMLSSSGRISPLNPFPNAQLSQKKGPSLSSRQTSSSPQQSNQPPINTDSSRLAGGVDGHLSSNISAPRDISQGFNYDPGVTVKREQPLVTGGRY